MTNTSSKGGNDTALKSARDLAAVATVDTLYRDVFLQRAIAKLRAVFPENEYHGASEIEPRIAVQLAESKRAVDRQDWTKVKTVSTQVTELRRELQEKTAQLGVAKLVYDAPSVAIDPLCVELQPLVKEQMTVAAARQSALEAFERLVTEDPEWADFHRKRRAYFEEI